MENETTNIILSTTNNKKVEEDDNKNEASSSVVVKGEEEENKKVSILPRNENLSCFENNNNNNNNNVLTEEEDQQQQQHDDTTKTKAFEKTTTTPSSPIIIIAASNSSCNTYNIEVVDTTIAAATAATTTGTVTEPTNLFSPKEEEENDKTKSFVLLPKVKDNNNKNSKSSSSIIIINNGVTQNDTSVVSIVPVQQQDGSNNNNDNNNNKTTTTTISNISDNAAGNKEKFNVVESNDILTMDNIDDDNIINQSSNTNSDVAVFLARDEEGQQRVIADSVNSNKIESVLMEQRFKVVSGNHNNTNNNHYHNDNTSAIKRWEEDCDENPINNQSNTTGKEEITKSQCQDDDKRMNKSTGTSRFIDCTVDEDDHVKMSFPTAVQLPNSTSSSSNADLHMDDDFANQNDNAKQNVKKYRDNNNIEDNNSEEDFENVSEGEINKNNNVVSSRALRSARNNNTSQQERIVPVRKRSDTTFLRKSCFVSQKKPDYEVVDLVQNVIQKYQTRRSCSSERSRDSKKTTAKKTRSHQPPGEEKQESVQELFEGNEPPSVKNVVEDCEEKQEETVARRTRSSFVKPDEARIVWYEEEETSEDEKERYQKGRPKKSKTTKYMQRITSKKQQYREHELSLDDESAEEEEEEDNSMFNIRGGRNTSIHFKTKHFEECCNAFYESSYYLCDTNITINNMDVNSKNDGIRSDKSGKNKKIRKKFSASHRESKSSEQDLNHTTDSIDNNDVSTGNTVQGGLGFVEPLGMNDDDVNEQHRPTSKRNSQSSGGAVALNNASTTANVVLQKEQRCRKKSMNSNNIDDSEQPNTTKRMRTNSDVIHDGHCEKHKKSPRNVEGSDSSRDNLQNRKRNGQIRIRTGARKSQDDIPYTNDLNAFFKSCLTRSVVTDTGNNNLTSLVHDTGISVDEGDRAQNLEQSCDSKLKSLKRKRRRTTSVDNEATFLPESEEQYRKRTSESIVNPNPKDEDNNFMQAVKTYGGDVEHLSSLLPGWSKEEILFRLISLRQQRENCSWQTDEKARFAKCLNTFGMDLEKLEIAVGTRSVEAITNYYSEKANIMKTKAGSEQVEKLMLLDSSNHSKSSESDLLNQSERIDDEEGRRKNQLLEAVKAHGAFIDSLKNRLSEWTEKEIIAGLESIREERRSKRTAWQDDEIGRLRQSHAIFGDDLDKLVLTVGTRSKTQIKSMIDNMRKADDLKLEKEKWTPVLEAVTQFGGNMVLLKKSLPELTDSQITEELASIRKSRFGSAWREDEIKRLNEGIRKFGKSNFKQLEVAVGTRTVNQIKGLYSNIGAGKSKVKLTDDSAITIGPSRDVSRYQETLVSEHSRVKIPDSFTENGGGESLTDHRPRRNKVVYSSAKPTRKAGNSKRNKILGDSESHQGSLNGDSGCLLTEEKKDDVDDGYAVERADQNIRGNPGSDRMPHGLRVDSKLEIIAGDGDLKEKYTRLPAFTSYIEELAYHYFAGLSDEDKLLPLPEVDPLPTFPSDRWTFDNDSRVLLADFRGCQDISVDDKCFLAQMMQRDDITLISDGLMENFDPQKWTLASIERAFAGKPYHKFRRFNRFISIEGIASYVEQEKFTSMKVSDFIRYLERLQNGNDTDPSSPFSYMDADGNSNQIDNIADVIFYMIDIDMPKLLPVLDKEYKHVFKVPEMLPGGGWCMMSSLPESARPFMGPNCYLTPGGGYTIIHQDGHGTVDSGHSNLSGFNEVVMLRRLPECHKLQACRSIPTLTGSRNEQDAINTLYKLPHDDGREETMAWPTSETIEEWKRMNYYPSVFILKPGQHVHINKGRLHAFRKLTCDKLSHNDCHYQLRKKIIDEHNLTRAPLCLSVAFDWMYWGFDKEGVNREVSTTIECAALCRDHHCKSLAVPETVLLKTAILLCERENVRAHSSSMLGFSAAATVKPSCSPQESAIIAGILPSLRYILEKDKFAVESATSHGDDPVYKGVKLKVKPKPDTFHDPLVFPTDPYGNDYFCIICNQELANSYFHCEGCELILNKDFNICPQCYGQGKFLDRIQVHPTSNKWYSDVNHLGHTVECRQSRSCPCHAGRCRLCPDSWCKACSCKCHKVFTNQFRFIDRQGQEDLLKRCEAIAKGNEVQYGRETLARLHRKPIQESLE